MKFKGNVSGWFYGIMLGVAAVLLPLIVVGAFVDPNAAALTIDLLVFGTVEVFCASIACHNFVESQEEALVIVFGFIRKRIPYGDIAALCATHDTSASLAASFDRIEILSKRNARTMISVIAQEQFFEEVSKRAPEIIIRGRSGMGPRSKKDGENR